MIERYMEWPDALEAFYKAGLDAGPAGGDRIIVCGMGGSAVAGDSVSLLGEDIGVEVHVVRGYRLPGWAREGLVYAVSFSGNTIETIRCAREARRRGLLAGVVTGGGMLLRLAEDYNVHRVVVNVPGPPRAVLGHVTGALAGLALGDRARRFIEEAARYMSYNDPRGEAERIANILAGSRMVFVVSCGIMAGLARRARSELAENAKMPARDDVYPESGHNDIESLRSAGLLKPSSLFLEWSGDAECSMLLDAVKPYYRDLGPIAILASNAPTAFAAFLDLSRAVGVASVMLASKRGVDSESLRNIPEFRRAAEKVLASGLG